ncbi:aminotransferase class I/II-fold pyridoxal phosphate-dependent enzyme [Lapidilactobacillus bayanensis]|uniref:aminotransferase class I/II-fold pyridoxal phosphate-dependent enzyme n=1 Tax=Lapidilactobacillus bayanensis TaxID=2485998 RepID=UPI000F79A89E|nr:aminotransferase class I/II-fold pyridoxal phosphate-dependent enzyme [Lapidilactobacillus bayanensis]
MPQLKSSLNQLGNHVLANISPSLIREIDNHLSQIPDIIKLTLGEPDFEVPQHIKDAAKKAIDHNYSHYAPSAGFSELRQQISDYLSDRFAAHYQIENEIVVTVGATEGIYAAIQGIFNPGDTIIIPTPSFPLYQAVAQLCGLKVVIVNTAPDYLLTPQKLATTIAQHPEAKGIILNYPNNPTGATYSQSQTRAVAKLLANTDWVVLSDEIYAELVYEEPHLSMATLLPEQTIFISGFSKSHAMTGYRIGYLAGPAALMTPIGKMHQFMVTTAASPMMKAAEECLRHGRNDAQQMREIYQQRRDLLLVALNKAGFTATRLAGAFYIFAKIPANMQQDDLKFVYDLAEEAHVGVIPGSVFGPGGEHHIRISYAAATADLIEAGQRIQDYVQNLNRQNFAV